MSERQVPESAVEALAAWLYEGQRTYSQPRWDAPDPPRGRSYLTPARRDLWRAQASHYLSQAYPAIRLQVLEEVREALTTGEVLEAAGKVTMSEHHFRPYDHIGRTYIEAALATLSEEKADEEGGR